MVIANLAICVSWLAQTSKLSNACVNYIALFFQVNSSNGISPLFLEKDFLNPCCFQNYIDFMFYEEMDERKDAKLRAEGSAGLPNLPNLPNLLNLPNLPFSEFDIQSNTNSEYTTP